MHHGRILDPASGSGGMFVQSAPFVAEHRKNPSAELSIFGVEKTDETGRLARMNLAVHGLEGDIRHGGEVNSYYDDPHEAVGAFDFALANPPFNVNAVDKDRLKDAVVAEYPDLDEDDVRQALAHAAELARERIATNHA